MKNIAICGSNVKNLITSPSFVNTIEIDEVTVSCGLIHTEDVKFDNQLPENQYHVLVRIIAFSCNYRDKSLIFQITKNAPASRFYIVGSDFVGEVVDVGSCVTNFKIGDRVIGNNNFPNSGVEGVLPGVVTNKASKEYQVFHEVKLMKIPPEMPDEVAAAVSINAQTAYSMVRKLGITEGSNVLVTAAKSNTSLFAINALKKYKANVYATTTSMNFADALKQMGVKKLISIDSNSTELLSDDVVQELQQEISHFDFIIDPFFDLHIGKLIQSLAPGGKYITCGIYDQYCSLIGKEFNYTGLPALQIFDVMMLKNLQIIGNCLGNTDDLINALDDYASGNFNVVIDSVFKGNQVAEFFDRTYNAKDRFGKVVYKYD